MRQPTDSIAGRPALPLFYREAKRELRFPHSIWFFTAQNMYKKTLPEPQAQIIILFYCVPTFI